MPANRMSRYEVVIEQNGKKFSAVMRAMTEKQIRDNVAKKPGAKIVSITKMN